MTTKTLVARSGVESPRRPLAAPCVSTGSHLVVDATGHTILKQQYSLNFSSTELLPQRGAYCTVGSMRGRNSTVSDAN